MYNMELYANQFDYILKSKLRHKNLSTNKAIKIKYELRETLKKKL